MKKPKLLKRHCPHCNKHTEHKVYINKNRGRSASHPLSRGSTARIRLRGQRRGYGNYGKYSKPTRPKMSGKKLSKCTDFRYTCNTCKKTHAQRWGIRAKKVEMI
ncbi:MAG TPA: 50S ribosomal protein L44e [Candidatus Nanoarchaeia archaeon]|nr:50S ribosomal protein L44e [Candidatus Nanoarchaeia archaeon]